MYRILDLYQSKIGPLQSVSAWPGIELLTHKHIKYIQIPDKSFLQLLVEVTVNAFILIVTADVVKDHISSDKMLTVAR